MTSVISQIKAELDRMNKQASRFLKPNEQNTGVTRLTEALSVAVTMLELAQELLSVPEHHQDDEWYEKEKLVNESLKSIAEILSGEGEKK